MHRRFFWINGPPLGPRPLLSGGSIAGGPAFGILANAKGREQLMEKFIQCFPRKRPLAKFFVGGSAPSTILKFRRAKPIDLCTSC